MNNRRLAFASVVAVSAMAGLVTPAVAVDGPLKIVPIFRVEFEPEDKFRHVAMTDMSSASAGQEVLALTFACTRSAPDANGNVKTTGKTKFFYRPAAGGANVFTPSPLPSVVSLPYPDPTQANNQCGGENQTEFDEGDYPNTQNFGCPRDQADPPYQGQSFDPNGGDGDGLCDAGVRAGHFGIGVANTDEGATRWVVFSDAVTGSYRNASTGFSDVDFTNFAIHVYAANGTRAWTKSFPGVAGAGRLEPVLCGVGDFLPGDGNDEVRIARIGDTETGSAFTYTYYNLATGAQIGSQVVVNISNP